VLRQHEGDRTRHCVLVTHVDDDVGVVHVEADRHPALLGESGRARGPDPGRRAGDQRDPPVEATHAVCSLKHVLEVKDGP
jgi:hypothetical protein